ncbi:branched-chain amino acid ABC transporter permease [Pseudonocardia ailaonensis]|uniref:Branched-chain amino acid ABC transporter permease n=1 Tax=Pseudonocardia ailaonensis TaxID=367279 RepID=A0ABN2N282_9PSEU
MSTFVQLFVNGLAAGVTYALIGLGLSLVFGVLKIINFAQGEFYMVAGLIVYTVTNLLGWPYLVGVPIAVAGAALLGWLLARVYITRLVRFDETATLVGTVGLSYLMLELAQIVWNPNPKQTDLPWLNSTVSAGSVHITVQSLLSAGLALLTAVVMFAVVYRTPLGRHMRAVAENPFGAALTGIRVEHVHRLTFTVGVALAGLAGATAGAAEAVYPTVGQSIILKGFVVVIVAGLGNISGAVWAGLMLGLVEALGSGYLSTAYHDTYGYLVLVLVLAIRPAGLARRKAAL